MMVVQFQRGRPKGVACAIVQLCCGGTAAGQGNDRDDDEDRWVWFMYFMMSTPFCWPRMKGMQHVCLSSFAVAVQQRCGMWAVKTLQ